MLIFAFGKQRQTDRAGSRKRKRKRVMTTTEIAKRATTKYFIEYINNDLNNTYWQLVRTKDAAILFANSGLENVYVHCFLCGISRDDVSLW